MNWNSIAPVTVVIGNTDLGLSFKETEVVDAGGAENFSSITSSIRTRLPTKLQARIAREKPDVVVFGHTHKKFCETLSGILFFNPGYAGKPKFGTERSAAILHCDEKEIRHEFIAL